jgi:hypothetical protein
MSENKSSEHFLRLQAKLAAKGRKPRTEAEMAALWAEMAEQTAQRKTEGEARRAEQAARNAEHCEATRLKCEAEGGWGRGTTRTGRWATW